MKPKNELDRERVQGEGRAPGSLGPEGWRMTGSALQGDGRSVCRLEDEIEDIGRGSREREGQKILSAGRADG